MVRIGFKKLSQDAKVPAKAHAGDAGMDVCALDDTTLETLVPAVVRTGIAADIPEGYEIQVRPRSGLATKGVTVVNAPGTIDSGYKGEIGVILVKLSAGSFSVRKGDRIAQLVVARVCECETAEVYDVGTSERGEGGFGSTGR